MTRSSTPTDLPDTPIFREIKTLMSAQHELTSVIQELASKLGPVLVFPPEKTDPEKTERKELYGSRLLVNIREQNQKTRDHIEQIRVLITHSDI